MNTFEGLMAEVLDIDDRLRHAVDNARNKGEVLQEKLHAFMRMGDVLDEALASIPEGTPEHAKVQSFLFFIIHLVDGVVDELRNLNDCEEWAAAKVRLLIK